MRNSDDATQDTQTTTQDTTQTDQGEAQTDQGQTQTESIISSISNGVSNGVSSLSNLINPPTNTQSQQISDDDLAGISSLISSQTAGDSSLQKMIESKIITQSDLEKAACDAIKIGVKIFTGALKNLKASELD